jgi:hypothetical protein
MAATFTWVESNLTAGDTGEPTNLNLGSTNARNLAPSTYPISASSYSFSKWVQGDWSGTFTRIENLKFWMSNSGSGYVTDEALNVSATTTAYAGTNVYSTPVSTQDSQASNAMPTAEPGTANVGIGGSLSGSLTAAGKSDFIVIQASIGASAPAGATQQKQFTLQYDEV